MRGRTAFAPAPVSNADAASFRTVAQERENTAAPVSEARFGSLPLFAAAGGKATERHVSENAFAPLFSGRAGFIET